MGKFNLSKLAKGARTGAVKHAPAILTVIGVAGFVATTFDAVRATPKALKAIEEEKERQNRILADEAYENGNDIVEQIDKLRPIELVRVTWKFYIPTVALGLASMACLIGASSVHHKRNAALATVYQLSQTALSEYKEKVIETIGEEKEREIQDKVAEERLKKNPVANNEVIIVEQGNTLCYDALSGRYFKSDINKIKSAVNEVNKTLLDDMYISLNEFYDEIGLSHTSLGNQLGWNVNKGLIDVYFGSHITEDGQPCVVLNHSKAPEYGYSSLY